MDLRLPALSALSVVSALAALSACTRPNPAFDGLIADETSAGDPSDAGTTGQGDGDGDGDSSGDGDGDGMSESSTTDGDPPPDLGEDPLLCPWRPEPGLAIQLGSPAEFGGVCPTGINVAAKLVTSEGGVASFLSCGPGCSSCAGELTLSAFPLIVTNYMPFEADTCLHLRTSTLVGEEPDSCYWGALTVRDEINQTPYVIATTHSTPPTEDALPDLGDLVPEPVFSGNCNCDDIGQGNDCCYQATPPEFWYFPFAGQELYAGQYAETQLPQWALSYYFKVFQAQRVGDCMGDTLQLSWAVTAAL